MAEERLPALAGDDERERAVERLRDGCMAGRLTLAEFSERVERALTARSTAELAELTADLPTTLVAPAPVSAARRVMAVMGQAKQRGRWRAGERINVVAFMGQCEVDLSQAEVAGTEIEVDATAVMGQIKLLVPPGVAVEMDGWAIMGAREQDPDPELVGRVRRLLGGEQGAEGYAAQERATPVIRLRTRVLMGAIKIEHIA